MIYVVCTGLELFLSIPVTVTTAERSFSKLEIIKSYFRNSMNRDRLSNLALLALLSLALFDYFLIRFNFQFRPDSLKVKLFSSYF